MDQNKTKEWLKWNIGKILVSIFELIIGILLFINPIGFTNGIIIACGAVMLLIGIINIFKYFTTKTEIATKENTLFGGLVLLTMGLIFTIRSMWFTNMRALLSIFYGVVMVLLGLNSIQSFANMIRLKNKKWFLELINAVIMLVFAIVIFANPFGTGDAIWMFTGVGLIVGAVYNIVSIILLSVSKKKRSKSESQPSEPENGTVVNQGEVK